MQNRRKSLFESAVDCASKSTQGAPGGKKLLMFADSPVTQDNCINEVISCQKVQ